MAETARWKFDETSGTNAEDTVGVNDLTASAADGWSADGAVYAPSLRSFDTASGTKKLTLLSLSGSVFSQSSFAFRGWIKGNLGVIYDSYIVGVAGCRIEVVTGRHLRITFPSSSGADYAKTMSATISLDTWTRIAIAGVMNPGNNTSVIRMFLNKTKETFSTGWDDSGDTFNGSGEEQPLVIGSSLDTLSPYSGLIDDIRLADASMSDGALDAEYDADILVPATPLAPIGSFLQTITAGNPIQVSGIGGTYRVQIHDRTFDIGSTALDLGAHFSVNQILRSFGLRAAIVSGLITVHAGVVTPTIGRN